jgi:cytokinin riboside 5'-monophosphate phosphoribohydrolase
MRVCVFCSSSEAVDRRLLAQGEALGRALAREGHEILYGGTALGTMGAVAAGAREAGGRVVGVLPAFLRDRGIADEACDELVVTPDLLERKREMMARSDAFVALPGGLGTLDELLEVVTHVYLGQLETTLVLLDEDGFWDGLLGLLRELQRQHLARAPEELLHVHHRVEDAVVALERPTRQGPEAVWRA